MGQIVVLLGIPVTQQEYLARVAQSDYLRLYRGDPEKHWHTTYERYVAMPLRDLISRAEHTPNVAVRTGATLADLCEVSKTARVIILVSHWKSYSFANDDLFRPVEAARFAQAAAQANHPLAQWLVPVLARHQLVGGNRQSGLGGWLASIKAGWAAEQQTVRDLLQQALDAPIDQEIPLIQGVSKYVESDLKRRTRRRDLMDALFSDLIAPGNRLELFDGLHDCPTISSALAAAFTGVLDLTACTSTILADHISQAHQYRFRVVQFVEKQDPIWAATILGATLRLTPGRDYLDARQLAIQLAREAANWRTDAE
jgi:hypothetical protein